MGILDPIVFTITESHQKLLSRCHVGWNDCEFGAASINPKRPYGNSSVLEDMAEILGIGSSDSDGELQLTEAEEETLSQLHTELKTVLEIGFHTLSFATGTYQKEWGEKWIKKQQN